MANLVLKNMVENSITEFDDWWELRQYAQQQIKQTGGSV